MKTHILLSTSLFVALVHGQDNETKVQFKDLPAAVQNTVKQQQGNGAVVRGYSKEKEHGKTFYEAETRVNGKNRDILMDEAGSIVEVEQQIEIGGVPPAAMQGIKRQAAGASVLQVESVTRGETVTYEAVIRQNGKKKEISVNADGSVFHEHQ